MVALEQALRRPPAPGASLLDQMAEATEGAPDRPLWVEIRRPDGTVLARLGSAGAAVHERRGERPLPQTGRRSTRSSPFPEARPWWRSFPFMRPGWPLHDPRPLRGRRPRSRGASLVAVEIAGALALLAAAVAAATCC